MLNSMAGSPALSTPFEASLAAIRVNVLWFASLIISLVTASFGMLVKQWLREYLAVENPSPQARLRIRHFREPELKRWAVYEIAGVLPLLLQLALGLFFVGLCYFTSMVHPSIGFTSLPLVAGWAFCFLTVTVLPAFFPRCPYKTTLLKKAIAAAHRSGVKTLEKIIQGYYTRGSYPIQLLEKVINNPIKAHIPKPLELLRRHVTRSDERKAASAEDADLDILIAVDAVQSNDELLETTITESLGQALPDWAAATSFVSRILHNRLDVNSASPSICLTELGSLSKRGREALLNILLHYTEGLSLSRHDRNEDERNAVSTIFSFLLAYADGNELPPAGWTVLKECLVNGDKTLCRPFANLFKFLEQSDSSLTLDYIDSLPGLFFRRLSRSLETLDLGLDIALTHFEPFVTQEAPTLITGLSAWLEDGLSRVLDRNQLDKQSGYIDLARTQFLFQAIYRSVKRSQHSTLIHSPLITSALRMALIFMNSPWLRDGQVYEAVVSDVVKTFTELLAAEDSADLLINIIIHQPIKILEHQTIVYTLADLSTLPTDDDANRELRSIICKVACVMRWANGNNALDCWPTRLSNLATVLRNIQAKKGKLEKVEALRICWFITHMIRLPRALEFRAGWMDVLGSVTLLVQKGVLEDWDIVARDECELLAERCLDYIQVEDTGDFEFDDTRYVPWAESFKVEETVFDDDLVCALHHVRSSPDNWRVRLMIQTDMRTEAGSSGAITSRELIAQDSTAVANPTDDEE
jgi:hypothetical protein